MRWMIWLVVVLISALLFTSTSIEQDESAPKGQIAFMSNRDGNSEIYMMDADGSNVKNLTNNKAEDVSASWSPMKR